MRTCKADGGECAHDEIKQIWVIGGPCTVRVSCARTCFLEQGDDDVIEQGRVLVPVDFGRVSRRHKDHENTSC